MIKPNLSLVYLKMIFPNPLWNNILLINNINCSFTEISIIPYIEFRSHISYNEV